MAPNDGEDDDWSVEAAKQRAWVDKDIAKREAKLKAAVERREQRELELASREGLSDHAQRADKLSDALEIAVEQEEGFDRVGAELSRIFKRNIPAANSPQVQAADEEDPPIDWKARMRFADDLKGEVVPALKFWVSELWPQCWLSLLNGDGGAGKSTLLTQLFSALSSGGPIFGKTTLKSSCMLLASEENDTIASRRLSGMPDVGRFPIFNLLDWPGPYELCWTRKDGMVEGLPFLRVLRDMIGDLKPEIVGLDHVGDLFVINENSKAEVNAGLQLLRPLHAEFGVSFALTQHISKAGMTSGRRDAGTPAWHNKSRWRAALYPPGLDESASEDERLAALAKQHRVLEIMKDSEGGTDGTKLHLLREKFSFGLEQGEIGKAKERSLLDKLETFIIHRGREDKIVHWPAHANAGGSLVSLFRKSFERGAPSFNDTVAAVDACVKSGALVRFETRNKAGNDVGYLRPKR